MIFTLTHTPGSLFRAMETLAKNDLNVTKIESRPIHGKPFQYSFHIDFEFEATRLQRVIEVLEEFKAGTADLKILGFYKKGPNSF